MTDRPIIFSATMVRSLLSGSKTMTRRLAHAFHKTGKTSGRLFPSIWQHTKPGDRLWVREGWANDAEAAWEPDGRGVYYRADANAEAIRIDNLACGIPHDWRSPIHMPRWASRLTLIVTATKIEPLQTITEADAEAEGVKAAIAGVDNDGVPLYTYRTGFVYIWRDLHGENSWCANPDVVALSFTVHKKNIDIMAKTATVTAAAIERETT